MRLAVPALLLAAGLAACSREGAREAAPGVSLLKDFSIAETDAGQSRWRLESPVANMDEKAGVIRFVSPRVRFYDDDKLSSEISSRAGTLQMKSKEAVLTDDVAVNSVRDGMKLSTTRLFYSSAKGKIWTDDPVTILKGRTVIKGRGFTANPDLSQIQIEHQETRVAPQ